MPVEIPCPGCRFLLQAGDEFAGESAPCPRCGVRIAVPASPQAGRITKRLGHAIPASNERVRLDPRGENAFPPHVHLPIPQHGEARVARIEPDEDHPFPGYEWPFGPVPPRGPRRRALYDDHASDTRVVSLLVEPLKRLEPFCMLSIAILGGVVLFGGLVFYLSDEFPYLALVICFAGCLIIRADVKCYLAHSATGPPLTRAVKEPADRR